MKITILSRIKSILKDYRWHGCSDFINLGLSYRNRISEWNQKLKEENNKMCIASESENGRSTFRYKLARREDCSEIQMQNGTRFKIIPYTVSNNEGIDLYKLS